MTQAIEFVCPSCSKRVGLERPGSAFFKAVYALMNGDSPAVANLGHYCPDSPPRNADRVIYARARLITVR